MLKPPPLPTTVGIMVCPVDDASSVIPFVLPAKHYLVALLQIGNPGRQVDVVADQKRVP